MHKAPLRHCCFDFVALPAGSALLGDGVDPLCQVANVTGGHACHGNSAILGHVHRKLLCQAFNLQEKQKKNNEHVQLKIHPTALQQL